MMKTSCAPPSREPRERNGTSLSYHRICSSKTRLSDSSMCACVVNAFATKPSRHFVRKAALAANYDLRPSGEDVLDPDWYQRHGILPVSI
eukprot:2861611-Amphidinium_carterae.1